jgi:hypothetical protein
MVLSSVIADVLAAELAKIAEAYAIYGIIFVVCLLILGLIIRGVKSFFRGIFKK